MRLVSIEWVGIKEKQHSSQASVRSSIHGKLLLGRQQSLAPQQRTIDVL
jgi:hypothetical protein